MTNDLENIAVIKAEANRKLEELQTDGEFIADSEFQHAIKIWWEENKKEQPIKNIDAKTLTFQNTKGGTAELSFREVPHLNICLPYLLALQELAGHVKKIAKRGKWGGQGQVWTAAFKGQHFSNRTQISAKDIENVQAEFVQYFAERGLNEERCNDLKEEILSNGRSLERERDYLESSFEKLCKISHDEGGQVKHLVNFALDTGLEGLRVDLSAKKSVIGQNIIYYGAPGTGKTYEIKQLVDGSTFFRTAFHLDYQNADFVGSLRPQTKENGDGSDITYEFVPGPFTNAYVEALRNESEQVFLVIEELNRGNAAAIFGDLFLLLDRDQDGKSEYHVDFSEELRRYLETKLENDKIAVPKNLKIPANLTLLATMNSSDQGVFTLDTAFRRRWNLKYLPINWDNFSGKLAVERCQIGDASDLTWPKFAKKINTLLMGAGVAEDKLLGPYFISEADLISHSLKDVLLYKVLNYLWEDVLRHKGRSIIFHESLETFGSVSDAVDKNKPVFSSGCITELMKGV